MRRPVFDVGEPDQYPTVKIKSTSDELRISVARGHWGTAEMRVVNDLVDVTEEERERHDGPGDDEGAGPVGPTPPDQSFARAPTQRRPAT